MLLLIGLALLALVWLGAAMVVVGLCVDAATGDRALERRAEREAAQRPQMA